LGKEVQFLAQEPVRESKNYSRAARKGSYTRRKALAQGGSVSCKRAYKSCSKITHKDIFITKKPHKRGQYIEHSLFYTTRQVQ
jgi:hypothetical protein